jgi:hypothetical protein
MATSSAMAGGSSCAGENALSFEKGIDRKAEPTLDMPDLD